MVPHTRVKLFSGKETTYLATEIADYFGQDLGDITLNKFSDGEMQPELNESVRGSYVFFIQSTFAPADNLLELLLMIDAAKRASAGYITAVIPFFGYARQDRKDKPRVPISAKLIANLIQAAGVNRIMTMDFHTDQIQGFFDIPVDHLKSRAIFIPFLEQMDLSNTVFASPDAGSIKRARSYARHFGTSLAICDKQRVRANEVSSMQVIGDVAGKEVIIVDDLVDTAGTLTKAAQAFVDKGAITVKAFCTHGVLSGNAYEIIESSVIETLIVTDTIPARQHSDKIVRLSCAKLFSRAIRNTHEHRSISALFKGE